MWTVTLAQHSDLLLDVLNLILSLLQVDGFDGHHILRAAVNTLENLSKRPLANALQFSEELLRICSRVLENRTSLFSEEDSIRAFTAF